MNLCIFFERNQTCIHLYKSEEIAIYFAQMLTNLYDLKNVLQVY